MSILLCAITPDNAIDSRNPGTKVSEAYRTLTSETEIRKEPSNANYISEFEQRQRANRDYLK